jgi:LPXTG-motif cell wall-anchored protein
MTVEAIANADAWKATWTNLPRYELIEGTPTEIMYRVVETAAALSDNGLIPADPVVVTAGQPVNIDNYVPVDLTILKVDSQGMTRPLAGAIFTIQRIDETASVLSLIDGTLQTATTTGTGSVETGADGVATFTGLTAGYYIVKETKLPDGYILTGSGSFYIAVENGQVKLVEKDEAGGWVASNEDAKLAFSAANETDPATVKVGNDAGYELPSTGGPGTNLLYLLGSMLVMLAGAGFILLQRKKRVE